jgi:hypothetical protein
MKSARPSASQGRRFTIMSRRQAAATQFGSQEASVAGSRTTWPTSCGTWRCRQSLRTWSLTTARVKLIKIGAKVVRHAKAVTFTLAEVAVPLLLFAAILGRIGRLRAAPSPG